MTQITNVRDPKGPDMSPEAIEARLREVSRLYRLGLALRNPKWVWRGAITEAEAARHEKELSE
jgi:hypothetical protein